MSKENIDYRAIVERIAEMLHGGVTDIGLLTITVQSYKDRLAKVEGERDELEEAKSLHDEGVSMLCGQFDELAAATGWTTEIAMSQGVSQLEYARRLKARIAELEARTVKLPPCVDDLHGVGMVMSADAVTAALSAAGINLETGGE